MVVPILAVLGGCGNVPPGDAPLPSPRDFGESGTAPGQFLYPRAIDAGAGSVWVIDKTARVQRLDPDSGALVEWWQMPQWKLGKPTGVTVWTPPAGDEAFVLVPDTHYHRVMIYAVARDPRRGSLHQGEGTLVAQFGSYGEGDGEFVYPTDVLVVPNSRGTRIERLYVSEYGGHDRISIFEHAGEGPAGGEYRFARSFGVFGSGPGVEFNRPQSMAFDPSREELVVTDACNHRVGRFTMDGALLGWIGMLGDRAPREGEGRFNYPYGLVAVGDGTVLVSEFGSGRVQRIDLATGSSVGTYGRPGRGEGELANPWSLALMGQWVFVLDSGHDRVQSFALPKARVAAREGKGATP